MAVKISIKPRSTGKQIANRNATPAKTTFPQAANKQSGNSGRGPVFFVLAGVCLLIAAVVAISSQSGTRKRAASPTITIQQQPQQTLPASSKFNELDGKSIGQWMKDNHTDNNDMVKERNQRRQNATYK